MPRLQYSDGEEVRAGDILGAVHGWTDQTSRVVVVIPALEAVDGYVASEWAYLQTGVMVEHVNAKGVHLVHYPEIDEDFAFHSRPFPDSGVGEG